jgi:solute carrier family 25 protein 33/36
MGLISAAEVKKPSSKAQLYNFLSGGLAGMCAGSLTIPLEVIKTQLQSSSQASKSVSLVCNEIMMKHGPSGFFKGLRPLLIGIIPTRAIYFWAYALSKDKLTPVYGNGALNHLCSAFAAGITSNTLTNPIWMVKTRFQIMANSNLGQKSFVSYSECVQSIMREEGPMGFFKGLSASYIGCVEGAIQWIVYEKLKRRLVHHDTDSNKFRGVELFCSAAASKFVAICASYPHEVVRTRLREQAANGVFRYKGFVPTLVKIGQEEGIRGLYGGLGMHLLRSVPNAAIMFLTYELTTSYFRRLEAKELLL